MESVIYYCFVGLSALLTLSIIWSILRYILVDDSKQQVDTITIAGQEINRKTYPKMFKIAEKTPRYAEGLIKEVADKLNTDFKSALNALESDFKHR